MLRLLFAVALAAATPHGVPVGKPVATPFSEPAAIALAPDGRTLYGVAGLDARSRLVAFAVDARTGALRRLRGRTRCRFSWIARSRFRQCAPARGLNVPTAVAVTPDGTGVIVASFSSTPRITSYARAAATGALRLGGCLDWADTRAPCRSGWVDRVADVAVSPDGRSVYVSSPRDRPALAVVARSPDTGALVPLDGAAGCVGHAHVAAAQHRPCTELPVRRFVPVGTLVSPDGRFVYVASAPYLEPPAVYAFARDPATGALARLPGTAWCLVVRQRPSCRTLPPLTLASFAISADGATDYAGGGAAVLPLARDAATGALTPLAPAAVPGGSVTSVAAAPDGRTVYAATGRGLASFRRGADGSLALLAVDRRISISGIVVARDARTLYGLDDDGIVAVALAP